MHFIICEKGYVELFDWYFEKKIESILNNSALISYVIMESCLNFKFDIIKRLKENCESEKFFEFLDNGQFEKICESSSLEIIEWLVENFPKLEERLKTIFNSNYYDGRIFTTICENGNLELIKWLHKSYNIDITMNNHKGLKNAWVYGNVSVVKYIYDNSKLPITVHAMGFHKNKSMVDVCIENGFLQDLKWLLEQHNNKNLIFELNLDYLQLVLIIVWKC